MILEIRTYTLYPGNSEKYWQFYRDLGSEIFDIMQPHLVGYFQSEIGVLNQIVHIWRYDDLAQRETLRGVMRAKPRWVEHLASIRPLVFKQETQIFGPAPVDFLSPLAQLEQD